MRSLHSIAACFVVLLLPALAQEPSAEVPSGGESSKSADEASPPRPAPKARPFMQIKQQETTPAVRAISAIDESNVFFLNPKGQIGVAKFSPGLSLIGWEYYSNISWNTHPTLAAGPGYSVVIASPREMTQAFDTTEDARLDFFQALVRDWPGRADGVVITAGPVADEYGRLLFALSPHAESEAVSPKARLMAWHPEMGDCAVVTESQLPIAAFAVNGRGLLAALLEFPGYREGYYISLTELPPHVPTPPKPPSLPRSEEADPAPNRETDPAGTSTAEMPETTSTPEITSAPETVEAPDGSVVPGLFSGTSETGPTPEETAPPKPEAPLISKTLPSLLLPVELTGNHPPTHLSFFREAGQDILIASCPGSRHLIEIRPDKPAELWQGGMLVRDITSVPLECVAEMAPGRLLGGGHDGFHVVESDPETFRITRIDLREGIVIVEFSEPVERFAASRPDSYTLRAVALDGGATPLEVTPVIESDGKTVILRIQPPPAKTVLRLACPGVTSESGKKLLINVAFYAFNEAGGPERDPGD